MRVRLAHLHGRRVLAVAAFFFVVVLVGAMAPADYLGLTYLPGVWRSPERWTEARPGWLYRSGQIPKSDVLQVLREHRIDVVLDLTDDTPDSTRDAERAAAEKLGIRYLHLPVVHPKKSIIENLSLAVAEIEHARKRGDRVLVHCTYGHRRSAAALALYARLIEHEPRHIAFAEFSRWSDAGSNWSDGVQTFLDRNMDAIEAQVRADLASPDPATH